MARMNGKQLAIALASELEPVTPAKPQSEPAPAENQDDRDFDWRDDSAIVIHEQPKTAVYLNGHDQVVIRQQGWPEDDAWVYVSRENLPALIRELQSYLP